MKTTIWWVLTDADAGTSDVASGTWLMSLAGIPAALMQVRLDGKAIRSAKRR